MTYSAARPALLASGITIWGAAIWASTQIHTIDLPLELNICGPWGCAAEPEAILGYHVLWATLLVPGVALTCRTLVGPVGRRVARGSIAIGAIGLLGLFGWGAVEWLLSQGPEHAWQRGLFVVATSPDLPVGQLALAGITGVVAAGAGRTEQANERECSR